MIQTANPIGAYEFHKADPRNQIDQYVNRRWRALATSYKSAAVRALPSTDIIASAIEMRQSVLPLVEQRAAEIWEEWATGSLDEAMGEAANAGVHSLRRADDSIVAKQGVTGVGGLSMSHIDSVRAAAYDRISYYYKGERLQNLRTNLRTLISTGVRNGEWGSGGLARALRPAVTLSPREMLAITGRYERQRLAGTLSLSQINKLTATDISRALDYKSALIAQNELLYAWNKGTLEHVKLKVFTGGYPADTLAVWMTTGDELVCPVCGPLHLQPVSPGSSFDNTMAYSYLPGQAGLGGALTAEVSRTPAEAGGKSAWSGDSPPAHISCRCTIAYQRSSALTDAPAREAAPKKPPKAPKLDKYNRFVGPTVPTTGRVESVEGLAARLATAERVALERMKNKNVYMSGGRFSATAEYPNTFKGAEKLGLPQEGSKIRIRKDGNLGWSKEEFALVHQHGDEVAEAYVRMQSRMGRAEKLHREMFQSVGRRALDVEELEVFRRINWIPDEEWKLLLSSIGKRAGVSTLQNNGTLRAIVEGLKDGFYLTKQGKNAMKGAFRRYAEANPHIKKMPGYNAWLEGTAEGAKFKPWKEFKLQTLSREADEFVAILNNGTSTSRFTAPWVPIVDDVLEPLHKLYALSDELLAESNAILNAKRHLRNAGIALKEETITAAREMLLTSAGGNLTDAKLLVTRMRDHQRRVIDNAQEWFFGAVSERWRPGLRKVTVKRAYGKHNRRAFYDHSDATIGLPDPDYAMSSTAETVVHELGHYLEDHHKEIQDAVEAFYVRRTTLANGTREKMVEITELTNGRWGRGEWVRPDDFTSFYTGKVYRLRDAAGKLTGRRYASEIVSVGLENMYKNPLAFLKADPEHFTLIWEIITGTLKVVP